MQVKELREEDAEAFLRLLASIYKEEQFSLEELELLASREDVAAFLWDAQHEKHLVLGAEEEGTLVGFLWLRPEVSPSRWHASKMVIGIRAEFFQAGADLALFHKLYKWCRDRKINRIETTLPALSKALPHFERMGFAREGIRKSSLRREEGYSDEYYLARVAQ